MVWLALLFSSAFLPKTIVGWAGLVLALALAPASYLLAFGGMRTGRLPWFLAMFPAIASAFYLLLTGDPASKSLPLQLFGVGTAAAGAVAVLTAAASAEPKSFVRSAIVIAGSVWWTFWAVAAATAVTFAQPEMPGRVGACASNMKQLVVGAQEYERIRGTLPGDVAQLVNAGIVTDGVTRCPAGGRYELLQPKSKDEGALIIICNNHPGYLITASRNTKTLIYRQVERE